jgi:hypothetical protein
VHRQGAGDDVERRVRQVQVLRDAHGERHGPGRAPPRVRDRGLGRVDPGDVAGRPGRGGQLAREVPAAAPHVQDRVSRPYPGQGDDPLVDATAAAGERDLADYFVEPEAVECGACAAPPAVQAPECVVH